MRKTMPLVYRNSAGEEINLSEDGYNHESSDTRSYSWDYETTPSRAGRFAIGPREVSVDVYIGSSDKAEGTDLKNGLYDVIDYDVRSSSPGKLIVGEWETDAFAVASKKKGYLADGRLMVASVTFLLPNPSWVKRETHRFFIDETDPQAEGLCYPHGYPHGYGPMPPSRTLDPGVKWPSDFRLLVYGPAHNPAVRIGANLYCVNVYVPPMGYLAIDSRDKTVLLVDPSGNVYNALSKRGRESYIFERLRPGVSAVASDNSFGFDLTVYRERSEPEWT